jgi:hypothetical protein
VIYVFLPKVRSNKKSPSKKVSQDHYNNFNTINNSKKSHGESFEHIESGYTMDSDDESDNGIRRYEEKRDTSLTDNKTFIKSEPQKYEAMNRYMGS